MLDRKFARAGGQSLVEYALIIGLVTLVVVVSVILLGPQLVTQFKTIENSI